MEYCSVVKKEWNTDVRYNMDKAWKHYAKSTKSDIKRHIYDSIIWNVQLRQTHRDNEFGGCQRPEVGTLGKWGRAATHNSWWVWGFFGEWGKCSWISYDHCATLQMY